MVKKKEKKGRVMFYVAADDIITASLCSGGSQCNINMYRSICLAVVIVTFVVGMTRHHSRPLLVTSWNYNHLVGVPTPNLYGGLYMTKTTKPLFTQVFLTITSGIMAS